MRTINTSLSVLTTSETLLAFHREVTAARWLSFLSAHVSKSWSGVGISESEIFARWLDREDRGEGERSWDESVRAAGFWERWNRSPQSHCEWLVMVGRGLQDGPSGELSLAVMSFLTHLSYSTRVRETRGVVARSRGYEKKKEKKKKKKQSVAYRWFLFFGDAQTPGRGKVTRHSLSDWIAKKLDFFVSCLLGARRYLRRRSRSLVYVPTTVSGAVIYEIWPSFCLDHNHPYLPLDRHASAIH